ncbi:ferredoxin--nitrite reductase, chloroplastic-like [Zingiber officinale]|nr:ferredoxin--nitrite reductase, chloroplastic-like [Zingiber officinale]
MASSSILQQLLLQAPPQRRTFWRRRWVNLPPTAATTMSEASAAEEAVGEERLDPRVEKREGGYWVLKEKYRTGINPQEKVKLEKEPMSLVMEDGILELSAKSMEEIDASKLFKNDIDVRLKWLGLFHRRKHQYGRFMMRLKLPNGVTTSEQTRYLASVVANYGEQGCVDITTRQNWQIRGVVLPDVPTILQGLAAVGLTSLQSGMDNVRNPVGNPLAGIDPLEIVDTRPYTQLLTELVTDNSRGNPAFTNLPRKWNVCVVGSHDLFEHPHINDLAYMPAVKDGKLGFNLLVGGFFSPKRCAEAIPLDAWVPSDDVVPLCKAILEAYRDLGSRGNRQKTRMMWLIDELGMEVFRSEVEKRMPEKKLGRAVEEELVQKPWERRSLLGVHPQKQVGLSFVGLHVPVGRLQANEMLELARLADEYGSGELRLTVEQNIIIPNVKNSRLDALLSEPLLKERFSPQPSLLMRNLVACTGNQFCGQAIIETKARALKVTEEVERRVALQMPVRMHWTGCPNTCGQVQVADIGFMGCMARDKEGKACEGVDIYLGGRIGSDSHLGELYKKAVPCKDLAPVVVDILVDKFGAVLRVGEEDDEEEEELGGN